MESYRANKRYVLAVLFTAAAGWVLSLGRVEAQTVIFQETFDNRTIGAIADPTGGGIGNNGDDNNWWSWNGPDSGNVNHTWSFVSDGSGGAALEVEVDGLLALGTDWWWGLGIGKSGIFPAPGTPTFADFQAHVNAQVINPENNYDPNTPGQDPGPGDTPPFNRYVNMVVAQWDPDAVSPDPNDPDGLGWWSFITEFRPQFVDGNWHDITWSLDNPSVTHVTELLIDPDGVPDSEDEFMAPVPDVMDPSLQVDMRFDWNNWNFASSMGLDDDNVLRLDDITITNLAPPAQPGDFDGDGDVDGADFVVWQTNFPTQENATLATGDADGDGDVDGADFVIWQTNFPFTPSSAQATVPEPPALALAISSIAIVASFAQRRTAFRKR